MYCRGKIMVKNLILVATCSLFLVIAQGTHVCRADHNSDLIWAVNSGDTDKVVQLLAEGANPNYHTGRDRMTVLMLAAYKGKAEIVNVLLENKASVNEKANNGVTALLLAAGKNNVDVVKILLDKGSDTNIRVEKGHNAYEEALLRGYDEIADLLRSRTKGAANLQVRTLIGPVEEKQKCVPVLRSPEDGAEKVGCLKIRVEVSTAGESGDGKWAVLEKPISGWVPMKAVKKVLVSKAPNRPSPRRSSENIQEPSIREERDTSSGLSDLPASGSGGGEWWRRGQ